MSEYEIVNNNDEKDRVRSYGFRFSEDGKLCYQKIIVTASPTIILLSDTNNMYLLHRAHTLLGANITEAYLTIRSSDGAGLYRLMHFNGRAGADEFAYEDDYFKPMPIESGAYIDLILNGTTLSAEVYLFYSHITL
jgi:hypothetical protein